MKQVIETLVEIESKAHNIIENAAAEKKSIALQMSNELKDFEDQVKKENDQKVKEMRIKTESEVEPERTKLYEEGNAFLSQVENKFSQSHDQMVNEVVEQIIS